MNKYYVYFHIRLDNNQVFYIGKGSGRRAYDKTSRSFHWHNIANKHGYKVDFFATNLTEQQAFDIEIEQINYHRSVGTKICNLTDGGDGTSGCPSTTAKKIINQFGETFNNSYEAANWCSGNHSKISACCRGERNSAYNHPITGEKLVWAFLENKESINDKLIKLAKPSFKDPFQVINQFGDIFNSMAEAARWCNGYATAIKQCCDDEIYHSGNHPTTNEPLIWAFLQDQDKIPNKVERYRIKNIIKNEKIINQFDMIFDSILDAVNWCGSNSSHILDCCYGRRNYAKTHPDTGEKLVWCFLKDKHLLPDKIEKLKTRKNNEKTKVTNQFGDIFNSITEAAKFYNICDSAISSCCKDKSKSAGKHNGEEIVWAYLDEKDTIEDRIKEKQNKIHYRAKKVVNQFGEIFNTVSDAARWCNVKPSGVAFCCKGKTKSAGMHPINGQRLVWCYEENINELENKKQSLLNRETNPEKRSVINQFGNKFLSIQEAAKFYNITASNISVCCKGRQLYAGLTPDTKEPILWTYEDQPEVLQDKIEKLKTTNIPDNSPIINQFGDVFHSYKEAAKWANCTTDDLRECCKFRLIRAGRHPDNGVRLVWVRISEKHLIAEKLEQLNKLKKSNRKPSNQKPVINQHGNIFPNIIEAANWCGVDRSSISKCCNGQSKTAGRHPQTKEKLIWKFHD